MDTVVLRNSTPVTPQILTINAGSSSIKFALFDVGDSLRRILAGAIERIGLPDCRLWAKGDCLTEKLGQPARAHSHSAAVDFLMTWLEPHCGQDALAAVGHRVVHGGPRYSEPQRISTEVIDELWRLSPFDPQHLPQAVLLIEALQIRLPDLPQVACFDTAFHHSLPRVAQQLAIPRRFEMQGVRRYGFHGLSYEFLMQELTRLEGTDTACGRCVLAHLGNGTSLAAVRDGEPIDTTMSFTPTSGVPMSTRSGDLDPGLISYLMKTEGMSEQELFEMVSFRSGLLGISETSSDMRDLLENESHDVRAAEAISLFCYQIKKVIGGYAAALGGLNMLVFAGGIGENAPQVRQRICSEMKHLGIELDESRNVANASVISSDTSRVTVRVIATDEERVIAKSTCRVVGLQP